MGKKKHATERSTTKRTKVDQFDPNRIRTPLDLPTVPEPECSAELDALAELGRWCSRWEGTERLGELAKVVRLAAGNYTCSITWAQFHQPTDGKRAEYVARLGRMFAAGRPEARV
jgi:hypothetical protein